MRGRFITLEGGEGAGKSTLIRSLADYLRAGGLEVIITREPGGTPGAEALREMLLTGETDRWSPMTEALLMYAARVDHVEKLIEPALTAGKWVLCDRFADSTTAYQGAGGGVPVEKLHGLHRAVLGDFQPDLTLVLDLDPRDGIARTHSRGEAATRFERFDGSFHDAMRQAFLDIAAADSARCLVLDASQSPQAVHDAAVDGVHDRLGVPA